MEQADTAFDALVAAYEPGPGPGKLRALVPLAGRALLEHQLRRATAAGAQRLLLLVDEVPVDLAEIITALRREGVQVLPVAGLDVAADALAPDRPVLLIADACLPAEAVLRRLARRSSPCLATLPDADANARYERIDAGTRWAGAALLDGARVASAAAMLGSWDPVSTLLRRAVQEDAARLDVAGEPPTLLLDATEVSEAEARIVSAARPRPRSWAERWIEAPLLALVVPRLLARDTPPWALAWPGGALALGCGALALVDWRWPALGALLVAFPLIAAGMQLARIADEPLPLARSIGLCPALGGAIGAIGLAWHLYLAGGQWGWLLCGMLLLLLATLGTVPAAIVSAPKPIWLAHPDGLACALVPFAIFGRWDIGLAALLCYAGASAAFLLRALVRQAAADAGLPPPNLF